ncbi:hypothetical protein [Curtobacterium sp. MCBD17_040]|uniref:hypothetical protein n=1 Tax=Curtobacterium sp. MCBD17_040 TaxID=2175674 RepID=UPI000DA71864|nr:hypothetical protein [Curtobacterium sp. MCBD17_040]WIB65511.1 hypothetical protein DEI94_19245 [Curtobacterium sp. MCBD17_040]
MADPALITPAHLARLVGRSLDAGDTETANRLIPDAISRVAGAARLPGLPNSFTMVPPSTGDSRYDTLIATAYAWALEGRGVTPAAWMTDCAPLVPEWMWDGEDATDEYRTFIRAQTPDLFLAKGLILLARDFTTA